MKNFTTSFAPVLPENKHINRYTFNLNKIIRSNEDEYDHVHDSYQLLMDVDIPRGRVFVFRVKVVKTLNRSIYVGIADR